MNSVEQTAFLPLYAQVKAALQHDIETRMKPGDSLPTEPELEERFGVSRITIRRAMEELATNGLVVRQQGRGTFVQKPPITQELTQLLSWTSSMRRLGYEPQTLRCEIDVVEPPPEICAMLQLRSGERAVRVQRTRGADGEPICLMTNYIAATVLPDLYADGLRDESVYATLAAHGLYPAHVEDTIEARLATAWESESLDTEAGSALLSIMRLSRDAAGHPLDVAVVCSRADRYRYAVHYQDRVGRALTPMASPVAVAGEMK